MVRTNWMVLVLTAGFAFASGPSLAVVDQYNLVSTYYSIARPTFSLGQDFIVGVSGLLTGIEIAALRDASDPGDQIILVLFDESSGYPRGYVSIPAANLPDDLISPGLSLETRGLATSTSAASA